MNIRNTFIELTSKTYPHGYENRLESFLPNGWTMDEDGNYYFEVGTGSKTIFASHLDTVSKDHVNVKHRFEKNIIKTNGKTTLGADDKAGVTILLYMIHNNVPGLYYFFIGEEVGCIGSTAAAKRVEFFSKYNKIVSFDRRGTKSIITHQSSKRSCSDAFADSLAKEYSKFSVKLEKDDTGVYTDSAEFVTVIPECTNISVGYYGEHTHAEYQDIAFLEKLAKASAKVNWESLVIERDPSEVEWKKSNYYYYGGDASYASSRTSRASRINSYGGSSFSGSDYYGGGRSGFCNDGWGSYRGAGKNTRGTNKAFDDDEFYGEVYKKDYYFKDGQKIYYDDIENEMLRIGTSDSEFISKPCDDSSQTDYYAGVRGMFLDDTLTVSEINIIKEQCLDMLDESDINFAKFLESSLMSVDDR